MHKKWIFSILAFVFACTGLVFYGCDSKNKLSYGEVREQIIDANLFENWQGVSFSEMLLHYQNGDGASVGKLVGQEGHFYIYYQNGDVFEEVQDVYYLDGVLYNKTPKEKEELFITVEEIIQSYLHQSYFDIVQENFDKVFKNAKCYDLENGYKVVLNINTQPLIEQGELTEKESDSGYYTYTFYFDENEVLDKFLFQSNSQRKGVQYSDTIEIEISYCSEDITPPYWFNIKDYQ